MYGARSSCDVWRKKCGRSIIMPGIKLTKEKETLLIPLYGKAKENNKKRPILIDKKYSNKLFCDHIEAAYFTVGFSNRFHGHIHLAILFHYFMEIRELFTGQDSCQYQSFLALYTIA